MRTAHIISRTGNTSKLVDEGLYSEVSAKFKSINPKAGERVELWCSGFTTKHKDGPAAKPVKKED
jgi:hypothetical protein